mgnify:CR=1 FL=1|tara:strand:+ start:388 stop:561 length:174 start_codon:yes stop_codon:yes gene_type:complete
MDILDKKTDLELAQSALAEIAKAKNEVQSAERDLTKAKGRLNFLVVLANKMIDRQKD